MINASKCSHINICVLFEISTGRETMSLTVVLDVLAHLLPLKYTLHNC